MLVEREKGRNMYWDCAVGAVLVKGKVMDVAHMYQEFHTRMDINID